MPLSSEYVVMVHGVIEHMSIMSITSDNVWSSNLHSRSFIAVGLYSSTSKLGLHLFRILFTN